MKCGQEICLVSLKSTSGRNHRMSERVTSNLAEYTSFDVVSQATNVSGLFSRLGQKLLERRIYLYFVILNRLYP